VRTAADCVVLQVVLEWDESARPAWPGCELPQLVTAAGAAARVPVSTGGLAAFGDVSAAEGSGWLVPDPDGADGAAAAVTCRIKVQLKGVVLGGDEQAAKGWVVIWEKEMLFSDDSQHLANVAMMSQAQRKHAVQAKV
jgi:hypothetical protein